MVRTSRARVEGFHICKATHIAGMTPEASKACMRDVPDRMIRPEIVYHHVCRKGDVLVIDDRATMHRATATTSGTVASEARGPASVRVWEVTSRDGRPGRGDPTEAR